MKKSILGLMAVISILSAFLTGCGKQEEAPVNEVSVPSQVEEKVEEETIEEAEEPAEAENPFGFQSTVADSDKSYDLNDEKFANTKKIALEIETLLLSLEEEMDEITLTYTNELSHNVVFRLKQGTVVSVLFSGRDKLVHITCRADNDELLDKTLEKLLTLSEFGFTQEEQENILAFEEDEKGIVFGTWDMFYHDAFSQTNPGRVFSIRSTVDDFGK